MRILIYMNLALVKNDRLADQRLGTKLMYTKMTGHF